MILPEKRTHKINFRANGHWLNEKSFLSIDSDEKDYMIWVLSNDEEYIYYFNVFCSYFSSTLTSSYENKDIFFSKEDIKNIILNEDLSAQVRFFIIKLNEKEKTTVLLSEDLFISNNSATTIMEDNRKIEALFNDPDLYPNLYWLMKTLNQKR